MRAAIGLMYSVILFGQATDVISGGAGWAGAGLLGLVLGWLLLKRLPDNDKQTKELVDRVMVLIAAKDQAIDAVLKQAATDSNALRQSHQLVIERICKEFRDDTLAERLACEKNVAALAASFDGILRRQLHERST